MEAANKNNEHAMKNLAQLLLEGKVVEKNVDLAINFLETSASSGNNHSKNILGKSKLKK
jgi:TPR repeat protein